MLSLQVDGVLAAGRGSGGEPDVLQVHVTDAGPFSKRGTYRWGWLAHTACLECRGRMEGTGSLAERVCVRLLGRVNGFGQ